MMHSALSSIEEVPYFFKVIHQIWHVVTNVTRDKKSPISPELSVSGLWFEFELTNGYEMGKKLGVAWKKCPIVFQVHPLTFMVTGTKSPILIRIERFRPVTPIRIHNGFWIMHKAWCSKKEVPYSLSKSSIQFQGQTGRKIEYLNPIWSVAAIKSLGLASFWVNLVALDLLVSRLYYPLG